MERLTDTPGVVRVLRGAPEPHELAALLTVLAAALVAASRREREVRPPARPTWRPFTGHGGGGWGRP